MKKMLLSICFITTLAILYPVDSFSRVNTDIGTDILGDDYKYIYVTLDVYDAKTGEYRSTHKNIKVRVCNGVYEIKFIYGWGKCTRSNKRGYDYYYSDAVNTYYFAL